MSDKPDRVEDITKSYLDTVKLKPSSTGLEPQEWEAYIESIKLSLGKGGGMARLRALTKAHPNSSAILRELVRALRHYGEYSEAATIGHLAVEAATETLDKVAILGGVALDRTRAGESDRAAEVLATLKLLVAKEQVGEPDLLRTIKEIAEIEKDDVGAIIALERLVELEPDDARLRFQLAYKHAQMGNRDLSIMHYKAIPSRSRDASAWNNLGVEYSRVGLVGKAVIAYREAEELGETLAMSNLAEMLISAGFVREAQELCDRAIKPANPHQNVFHSLSRLRDLPDEEEKKEVEIAKHTKPKADFYRRVGKAITLNNVSLTDSEWQGPDCVLSITLSGNTFTARGTYEQPRGLAALIAGPSGSPPYRMTVEYTGTVRGRTVDGHVLRSSDEESLTLLSRLNRSLRVVMEISMDGSEIKVMELLPALAEKTVAPAPKFYSFTRVSSHNPI